MSPFVCVPTVIVEVEENVEADELVETPEPAALLLDVAGEVADDGADDIEVAARL